VLRVISFISSPIYLIKSTRILVKHNSKKCNENKGLQRI
jgi:hypothetical protein